MNKYGKDALRYWSANRPSELAQMTDPEGFFSTLGTQIAARVLELSDQYADSDPAGESYLEKVGRLNEARVRAEETAMDEFVWTNPVEVEPEPDSPSEVDQFLTSTWRMVHDELQ
jgi:hypothetical protein